MAATRLLMRRLRELLRLKYDAGLSHRAIAQACALGLGTVTLYLQRATAAGLHWPLPDDLDDATLEARVFAHSGVAGIMNVPATAQELVFVQSVANVAKCLLEALRIIGTELEIPKSVEAYNGIVDYLDDLMAYAVSDAVLRLQGEPQRLFFRTGPWSVTSEPSA